ncbi:MAG: alpha/beta hydrolase [Chitinophagaceae bacterium]|nr:MAG: alpha/beta hydrolase [Chitinophagaceae bacterium]
MKKNLLLLMLIVASVNLSAQEKPLPLYKGVIPGSKPAPPDFKEKKDENGFVSNISVPTITPYFPETRKTNSPAVLVFPGGGYAGLAMAHEGDEIAKAFTSIGFVAFVVKNRLPDDRIMVDKKTGPLQDAQQAIHLVRERAAEFGIDPARTGIIGFSAGGHLASTAGTHFDKNYIGTTDNISLVPSFMLLIYPVISFGPITHRGSREHLLGNKPSADLVSQYSNETRVTAQTPPTFLVHSADDAVVPVKNSLVFFDSLQAKKIPSEIHVYEKGGHGFGLHNRTTTDNWFDRCAAWLKTHRFS